MFVEQKSHNNNFSRRYCNMQCYFFLSLPVCHSLSSFFFPLPVQTDRNVTVVLLSEIVWELFRPSTGCFEPFTLYFPDYSIGKLIL